MVDERFRKDVTDADIDRICGVEITELTDRVIPRAKRGGGNSVEIANNKDKHAPGTEGSDFGRPETLNAEMIEFLESIVEKPNLTITQRRDYLGLSTYRNDRIKKALLAKGLIVEVPLNFGRASAGIAKFLILTDSGYEALHKKAPYRKLSNCSPEHWFWQRSIAAHYRAQGYETKIEMCLNGKRADVGFVKDGKKIAVEVGLSASNEAVNVQKDFVAGFDNVLVACRDTKVKKAVEERLKGVLSNEQLARVKLILLSDFSFVKEILGK